MPILTQETYVHLPIFFTAYAVQDHGELEAIPADCRVRGVVHLGQAASPSQPDSNTLPHTHLWPIYNHPEDTHVGTERAQAHIGNLYAVLPISRNTALNCFAYANCQSWLIYKICKLGKSLRQAC